MRMKRKKVWLMCGIPGSGKSTWIQKQMKINPGVWCSRDAVRFSMIGEDEDYFAREDEVFETWIFSIQAAIANSEIENVYIDATHLNEKSRDKVLNRLNLENATLCAVNFTVPLGECIRRNDLREGRAKVPRSVIRRMHFSFVPAEQGKKYKEVVNVCE